MDSLENTANILTSSENISNENQEKELSLNFKSDNEPVKIEEPDQKETDADRRKSIEEEISQNNELTSEDTDISDNKDCAKNNDEIDTSKLNPDDEIQDEVKVASNKNPRTEINDVNDDYSKHVTYNELGEAIYTDPSTNYKYQWSQEKNNWEPIQSDSNDNDENKIATAITNPYENEHYRWCSKKNQWIPKTEILTEGTTVSADGTIETEFYKWDKEANQWIPKTQSTNVVSRFEDGVHTYTDRDGAVYFWDTEKNAWFPKIDDEFMARYQLNYGFNDNTTLDESKTNDGDSIKKTNGKQRQDSLNDTNNSDSSDKTSNQSTNDDNNPVEDVKVLKRKLPEPPKWFDIAPEQNTKVYVSNLPDDITEDEFVQVMSKCGLIMRDPKTQKHKIKLYAESDGQLKGDGLCDYIKVESVELALNLLDGYDVRGHTIKVQRAKFQMRGEYNPLLKPKRKKKEKEKLQKMKERLFDWRPEKMRGERSKHERNVIIKNLFEPELFDKEVHLIIEYQNDLREECSKCGTVRKVVIFDRHSDGVAQITMSSPEEADLVVQMMNRRFFGQRRLLAEIWDGKTKYKVAETDAEIQKRITNWDKYLEEDEKNTAKQQDEKVESKIDSNNDKLSSLSEPENAALDP